MITGGTSGEYGGVLGTIDPYGLNNSFSPGNNCQAGTVYTVTDMPSAGTLLYYLAGYERDYRNFYFFGHGSASSIGAKTTNGWVGLTQGEIADFLWNVPLSYQVMHAAFRPYRFVFIDGCDTAKANFCEAFAIPAVALSTNYFAAAGIESRAFVGFKSWSINLNTWNWQAYSLMTEGFLRDWMGNVPVQSCLNNAKSDIHGTGRRMDSSAVVYGAADLQHATRTRP